MQTLLITGANRGLGLEFVRQYAEAGWRVHACCRSPKEARALLGLAGDIRVHALDVESPASIGALAASLEGEALDLVINNAGLYGRKGVRVGGIDPEEWARVLTVNTIAPALVAEALLPNLEAGAGKRLVILGSKVGSMADNRSGRNYPYRSSKAGANAVAKSLSIDLREKGIVCAVLHPGWVKTEMGGPGAIHEIEESVTGMRRVIAGLAPEDSGRFLAFDGSEIPW